ncbi:hypothetical protein TNCV_3470141 [Trichonephila clavipes]|nr:hypothetical protein TNCV_3470141 [Trichonephila clavipes]
MLIDNVVVRFLGWAALTSSVGLCPVRGSLDDTCSFVNPTPLAHADSPRDNHPIGGLSQPRNRLSKRKNNKETLCIIDTRIVASLCLSILSTRLLNSIPGKSARSPSTSASVVGCHQEDVTVTQDVSPNDRKHVLWDVNLGRIPFMDLTFH